MPAKNPHALPFKGSEIKPGISGGKRAVPVFGVAHKKRDADGISFLIVIGPEIAEGAQMLCGVLQDGDRGFYIPLPRTRCCF